MPIALRVSLLISLFLGLVVPQDSLAQDIKGLKTITHRGNTFLVSPEKRDTVIQQTERGEVMRLLVSDPFVLSMNGDTVYTAIEVATRPLNKKGRQVFESYVLSSLEPYAKTLPNGHYTLSLSEVIVDKAGRIVYYSYDGLLGLDSNRRYVKIPDGTRTIIKSKIEEIIEKAPQLHPGKRRGKSVVAYYVTDIDKYKIEVADGVVRWAKKE